MSHFFYLIFYLLLVISVRRQTRSSRIARAKDLWPRGRQTQDYLLRSNVQPLPYQGVHPSRRHRVDTLLDIFPGQLWTRLNPLQQQTLRLGRPYDMRPQDNGGLQDVHLSLCILLSHRQVELLRRVGFIPTPQKTNRDLRIGHPLHYRLIHLHGEGVLLLQLQMPLLQVGNVPPQRGTLRVLVRNKLFLTSVKDRTHLLFHSLLLIEELSPQDSGIP